MKNKICLKCRFYLPPKRECPRHSEALSAFDKACDFFMPEELTNGDKIIAGGMRELAKCMVYGYQETADNGEVVDGMLYTWKHPQAKVFTEYNEAVDYLEAWLNAPAGKDNNVPAKESEADNGCEKCEYCGKTYRKKKKEQRFCSIKCKDKWWNRERAVDREYLHPQCEDNFNGDW